MRRCISILVDSERLAPSRSPSGRRKTATGIVLAHCARHPIAYNRCMGELHVRCLSSGFIGLLAFGCASSAGSAPDNSVQNGLSGTAFGQPFTVRDTLLVHPQSWKSASAPGSTAILLTDTPNLCAQITSRKTTAPGRLVIVALEQSAADGSLVYLDPGQFTDQGQGTPLSHYGEVFLGDVDVQCHYSKLFTDQSSIQVTAAGPKSSPVSLTLDVHFTSGDSLKGSISATTECDETAVDTYLNSSPICG